MTLSQHHQKQIYRSKSVENGANQQCNICWCFWNDFFKTGIPERCKNKNRVVWSGCVWTFHQKCLHSQWSNSSPKNSLKSMTIFVQWTLVLEKQLWFQGQKLQNACTSDSISIRSEILKDFMDHSKFCIEFKLFGDLRSRKLINFKFTDRMPSVIFGEQSYEPFRMFLYNIYRPPNRIDRVFVSYAFCTIWR